MAQPSTTTADHPAPAFSPPPSSAHAPAGRRKVLICLLRLDLRINDNALWHFAHRDRPDNVPPYQGLNASKLPEERALWSMADHVLPLYVFDERELELSGLPGYERKGPEARTREYKFWKTGAFRARFIAESVYDLRSRLKDQGSDLCIRFGLTEDVVANIVRGFLDQGDEVEGVWMQKEMTSAEISVEKEIEKRLAPTNTPVRFVHGKTLIHPADLPFEISETPDVFTPFRKRVEALGPSMVRPAYTAPAQFKPFPAPLPKTEDYAMDISYEVDVDGLALTAPEPQPKADSQTSFYDVLRCLLYPLNEINFPAHIESSAFLQQRHHASAFPLRGGESSAQDRLEWYFIRGKSPDSSSWGRSDPPPVSRYKQTRNNLLGHAYSTKMSPFLAYGSISPRSIWEALLKHESIHGEDQNIYWVKFELLWRDYFFFVAEKFGDLLFHLGGFELATDPAQAQKKLEPGWWKTWDHATASPTNEMTRLLEGRTGIPFIDANMRELRESGFISNRGRQNIASYVAHDLGYDWRIGAEFFQSYLIDYDPTSNYGNWAYVAGVGNDPRASRRFNIIKQAKDYDSHGDYVKTWLPALRGLPADYVHTPWLLSQEERRRYGVKASDMYLTMDTYPDQPMTEDEGWKKHYERKEGVGSRMYGNPQEKIKDGRVKRYKRTGIPAKPQGLSGMYDAGAPRKTINGGVLSSMGGGGGAPGTNVHSPAPVYRTGPPLKQSSMVNSGGYRTPPVQQQLSQQRSNSPSIRGNGRPGGKGLYTNRGDGAIVSDGLSSVVGTPSSRGETGIPPSAAQHQRHPQHFGGPSSGPGGEHQPMSSSSTSSVRSKAEEAVSWRRG
ncbi:unnamed protein product [Sympodiomycopsis kandeliae]